MVTDCGLSSRHQSSHGRADGDERFRDLAERGGKTQSVQ